MADENPGPTPEGRLIEQAAKASGRSIRQLAANAGMSDTRWRQVVRGWQENSAGKVIEARASDEMLARMAYVVGLEPGQLTQAGRPDAAKALGRYRRLLPDGSSFLTDRGFGGELVIRERDGTTTYARVGAPAHPGAGQPDEIDLIYASSMSAREKLVRIRQVLELRAQAEAEEAQQREKAPAAEAAEADNH
jgi:hypothetical protein